MGDGLALAFFVVLREIVRGRIDHFMTGGLERMYTFVGGVATVMVTIWIMIQGYRIMTGQSKDSLLAFVLNAAKIVVILSVAMTGSFFGSKINEHIHDFQGEITYIVTGENKDVYTMVDQNLLKMQAVLSISNMLSTENKDDLASDITRITLLTTFGIAGPAVIAGTLSLLNEIAIALAVMFGPLFILALMFENTKNLFWNWVRYTVGVMFSMAVLAMMTGIALKISYAYAAAMAAASLANLTNIITGKDVADLSSTAMQQGGLGLILSTLLLTVPPMVMQFFSSNLGGAVSGYSPLGAKSPEQQNKENNNGGANNGGNAMQDGGVNPPLRYPAGTSSPLPSGPEDVKSQNQNQGNAKNDAFIVALLRKLNSSRNNETET